MNQHLQRLIVLAALCALFLTVGVALVAAQGPDNAGQVQQTEVEGARPLEGVTVEAGETSFTVSWKTKTAETGWVEYGTSPDALDVVAYDERGQDVVDIRHHVVVDNLDPGMGYYFVVVSGGEEYDNAGLPFKVLIGEEAEVVEPTVGVVEASESVSPAEVVVTGVGDTRFTVTWKTATARSGWVEYGASPDKIDQVAYDERGQEVEDVQHQVALEGLEPGTVYYFVIVSGGEKYENAGSPFKVLIGQGAEPDEPSEMAAEGVEIAHPTGVAATEVGDTQFTVGWETASAEAGWVEYGKSPDQLDGVAYDEKGQDVADTQHRVTVEGLEPGAVYYFVIVSGGEKYDNAGSPFKVAVGQEAEIAESAEGTAEAVEAVHPPARAEESSVELTIPPTFDRTYVLSNDEFNTSNALTREQIRDFLNGQPGPAKDIWVNGQPAYQIIYDQATNPSWFVNPKLLLAKLEVEMSLVTQPHLYIGGVEAPLRERVACSLGCGASLHWVNGGWVCSKDTSTDYRGFDRQVMCAAQTFRNWYNRAQPPFTVSTSDEGTFNVQNEATFSLYKYTPSVSDKRTLRNVWSRFFGVGGSPDPRQEGPVSISGTLQRGSTAYFTVNVRNYGNAPTPAMHPYIEGTNSAGQFWRADGSQPPSAVIQPGQTVSFRVQHDLWSAGTWTANGIYIWNNDTNQYWKPLPANGQNQQFSFYVQEPPPSSCPDQYRAEYFSNRTLSGSPTFVRCEGWPINHDWGSGGPGNGVGNDNFSARWTGRAHIADGTYTFIARADDGIRVWVGGNLLIDEWHDQPPTEYRATRHMNDGHYDLRIEYYENSGGAVAQFRWERATTSDPDDGRVISSGQTLWGTINPASDEDTYYFDASQGQRATIRMTKSNFTPSLDPYLILYAPNGSEVARNDDGGGNLNALIDRATLPQGGRYRIVARSFNHSSSGQYSLSLNLESSGGGCNPGANGVVLYEHTNYTGRCVTFIGDDNDFINDNFNDVASSIRFVGTYASGREAQVYEHTYYGGVSSTFRGDDPDFGNDTIGHDRASSIRIRRVNSDPDDGRLISSGQTLWGTINPAGDEDTYYFDASQGQRATIRMTKNNFTPSLDPYLILYAPNGSEVARNDDGGGNLNALIDRATLPQSGRYRVVARSFNHSSSGQYSLSLNLESGGSSNCPDQYRAEYYNNRYLSGSSTFVQCEGWPVNHDWGSGGPGHGVGNDNFSARWTGRAHIADGTYTFIARADDGIRVWVGNDLIVNEWHDQPPTEYRVTRHVSDGDYDIKVEYYENGGGAVAQFRWERQNSSACNGTALSFGQTVGGWLSNFIPGESYCFTASAGQWGSIRMFAYNNNSLDTYIKLYTPDGRLFARDDDGAGTGYNSFLVERLPQSGTYRLEATRFGSTSGDYRLRLEGGREAAVGDIDRNCVVNARDVSILMSRWGTGDQDADLNLDGVVNSVDSSILQSNFGRSCP